MKRRPDQPFATIGSLASRFSITHTGTARPHCLGSLVLAG